VEEDAKKLMGVRKKKNWKTNNKVFFPLLL
jgi:hypothetical protein